MSESEESVNETIHTEFDTETDVLDNGVEIEVTANEEFLFHGEPVERETTLAVLEDGGVQISQKVKDQGIYDSLTLGSDVVRRLVREVDDA